METGQGHIYLEGKDDDIERFVEAPAAKAKIAHLVSGFRDSAREDGINSMNHMHLGSVPLIYFNNSAPSWWPASFGDSWKVLPNNTNPETTIGRQFWADVCASYIVANFDDEAEFLEIDFTVSPGLCSAYAYSDPNAPADTRHSHAAPDDVRAYRDRTRTHAHTSRSYNVCSDSAGAGIGGPPPSSQDRGLQQLDNVLCYEKVLGKVPLHRICPINFILRTTLRTRHRPQ